MSDGRVHIRDLMVVEKKELKETGVVPNVTMCGENDPQMNRLTFGDPAHVLQRKVVNPCERCIAKWRSEEESNSNYKKNYNDFRKIIHKAIRGGYR
jgi:hypothetical protein